MKKLLKNLIRKCFFKIYAVAPPPSVELKLNYLCRTLGACNIDFDLIDLREFQQRGGDYFPNYIFPKSWNEKVGYYKSNYYTRSPISTAVDHKWLAKKITEKWVGEQYVVPTFGIWDKATDINWDKLPKSFVLKSCIGFQGKHVIVVNDKDSINKKEITAAMQGYIDNHCSGFTRKKIIAEMLLLNRDGTMPFQYEFYCGRGNPLVCRINMATQTKFNTQTTKLLFYDIHNWQKLPIQYYLDAFGGSGGLVPNDGDVECPLNLDKLLSVASQISSHLPISRIDLYLIDKQVFVGEITIYPGGGFSPIVPSEWDFRLGQDAGNVITARELDKMIDHDKREFSLNEIK